MNILAIDTATEVLSCALRTSQGQWYIEADAGLRHSELLMGLCGTILDMAGIERKQLELVACMEGPGSFTGLRIGFAAAKGIAAALDIPFIAVPTLDCMAYPYRIWPGYVLPLIDAKKQSFFTALYQNGNIIYNYTDSGLEDILAFLPHNKPILVTGPGAELFLSRTQGAGSSLNLIKDPQNKAGKARELLEKAENWYIINKRGNDLDSGPLYLRKSDAEILSGN